MSMTQLLFSFQGRLNRKPYWMTAIATMLIIIVLLLFALILIREHRFEFAGLTLALLVILYIPLIWIVSPSAPSGSTTATSPRGGSSSFTRRRES